MSLFPSNKVSVMIHTNDHNPPHFHVEYDDWDISFLIADGEEFRINRTGKQQKSYRYIKKSVKKWLNSKCATNQKYTNKENMIMSWKLYHNEENN